LIIGDDLLEQLPRWRNLEQLLRTVYLVVISRRGVDRSLLPKAAAEGAMIVDNPEIPVSSTALRTRLREGRSVRYLVPEVVYEYIRRHALYQ
jgi:nicotinate-nucleotide adenylyltransferase